MPVANDPALSVIIPHFNNNDALADCLRALASQRSALADEVEVLVVDNGSDMLPTDICAHYDFVTLLKEAAPGPGPARNTGAFAAKADILAFIDSDCLPSPNWLQTGLALFTGNAAVDADVVGGDIRIVQDAPALSSIAAYESVFGYRQSLYVTRDHYAATCNMVTKKSVFETVGGFAGIGVAEDFDWGQRATALGVTIAYVDALMISTPARRDFSELARKWDRHIAHEFEQYGASVKGRARIALKACLLAISPLRDVFLIAKSDRLHGIGNKIRALKCLTQIRLYRATQMAKLVMTGNHAALANRWRAGTR